MSIAEFMIDTVGYAPSDTDGLHSSLIYHLDNERKLNAEVLTIDTVSVPDFQVGRLVGARHAAIKKISDETSCEIHIDPPGKFIVGTTDR